MQVKTQPEDLQDYITDASNLQGGHAEKLFIPDTTEEVSKILREANSAKIPVTIAGARTGTVGGAIPFGGIVISLERFNKIGAVDRAGSLHAYIPPASNSAILVIIQSVALNKVHKKKPLWNLFMDIGCESVGCLFVALK